LGRTEHHVQRSGRAASRGLELPQGTGFKNKKTLGPDHKDRGREKWTQPTKNKQNKQRKLVPPKPCLRLDEKAPWQEDNVPWKSSTENKNGFTRQFKRGVHRQKLLKPSTEGGRQETGKWAQAQEKKPGGGHGWN